MKKALLISILALLGMTQAAAQEYEYVPFVREGVKWEYSCFNFLSDVFPYGTSFFTLEMKGDTVIEGKHYKPVHLYSGEAFNEGNDTIPVYLREEDKVVYAYIPNGCRYVECPVGIGQYICGYSIDWAWSTGEEHILYDFNDMARFYDYLEDTSGGWVFGLEYKGEDMVKLSDHLSKRHKFKSVFEGDKSSQYIIEGIGYIGNWGMPLSYFQWAVTGMQNGYWLERVVEEGKVIYENGDFPFEYEYVPFVREGVKWTYSIQDYHYETDYLTNPARGDNKVYRTLEIKGDTIINGKTYKAVHMCVDDQFSEPKDIVPVYLREEDKMVYGIVPDGNFYDDAFICTTPFCFPPRDDTYSGEEFLLYDFQNMVTYWDNLLIDDDWYNLPLRLDSVQVGGHYAKRYFDERQEGDYFQVIEGIGATGMNSYPLGFIMPVTTGIHTTEYYSLEKVVENGEVIYPQNYVEDRYQPVVREGVKWVNAHVVINDGDTTYYYYTYEFKGNYPETDSDHRVYKALYSMDYDASGVSTGNERLVAGLRENEALILSFKNEPLNSVDNFINFYSYDGTGDVRLLHENLDGMWDIDYYIYSQLDKNFLNTDNFVEADPIEIDGMRCSRIAYIGEQGDTLAYLVEGIGFDSRDLGDLLTPFTRYPEADCGECFKEYCGLSHVIKDGKIIYKGMLYRPIVHGDANGDGEITIADANNVIDIVVMGGNNGHTRMPAADMNGDNEITIADVNAIIDFILKKD